METRNKRDNIFFPHISDYLYAIFVVAAVVVSVAVAAVVAVSFSLLF